MRRGWMVVLLVVLVLVIASCSGAGAQNTTKSAPKEALTEGVYLVDVASVTRSAAPPREGDEAPNFVFVSDDGQEFALSDFRGHPVVINFWATWCPPCRMEMPSLDQAYHTYKEKGLVLFAVDEMEKRADVLAFRKEMKVSLPMVLDTQGLVGRTYLVRGLPTTFFVDKTGHVVVRWTGMLTEDALQRNLQTLFNQGE